MELNVDADNIGSGKWSVYRRVKGSKLGCSSIVVIFNEQGFLLYNISSDGPREIPAAESLCAEYRRLKGCLFRNEPVWVWIVYEQENAEKGRCIRSVMQRILPARVLEQVYNGESFMDGVSDEGAQFCLELVGGSFLATMCREDGAVVPEKHLATCGLAMI
ncbi:unnamed protein product [Penicillium glandicola]